MMPFAFPVLTDENIHPSVITYLRQLGIDVLDVKEQKWMGMNDEHILSYGKKMDVLSLRMIVILASLPCY